MKRLLLILIAGLALNAVQWHRRSTAIARPAAAPPVQTVVAAAVPARPAELTALEKENAEDLAIRLLNLPSSRSGEQVAKPSSILAEAEKLPDAAYFQFARTVVARSADPLAKSHLKPQTVFIRMAERNAVLAFDWVLTEAALHTGQLKYTAHSVFAWWTIKDPGGARRWMLSALQRDGLSAPAASWLAFARRNFAAALAGSIPEEAAAILVEKATSDMMLPRSSEVFSTSLPTPVQRSAFVTALNAASAPGEPWTEDGDLFHKVLGAIGRNGGPVEEYLTACASLPGKPDDLSRLSAEAFRHFGKEPEFIAWAEKQFPKSPWIGRFMEGWVQRDMEAATAWLAGRPPDLLRDAAIEGMMRPLEQIAPEVALAWALEVTDTTKHKWLCRNIFQEWSESAPEDAVAAFRAKGIPLPSR